MKRLFFALMCAILTLSVTAQETSYTLTVPSQTNQPQVIQKAFWQERPHNLDITYGPASAYTFFGNLIFVFGQIADQDAKQTTIGCFGLEYHYQTLQWLAVGVRGTYAGQMLEGSSSTNYIHWANLMASVQFTYLNHEVVKLYSGIDLGAFCAVSEVRGTDAQLSASWGPAVNLTLFGVTFGRKVYGLAELNAGCEAAIKIGLGVRF